MCTFTTREYPGTIIRGLKKQLTVNIDHLKLIGRACIWTLYYQIPIHLPKNATDNASVSENVQEEKNTYSTSQTNLTLR